MYGVVHVTRDHIRGFIQEDVDSEGISLDPEVGIFDLLNKPDQFYACHLGANTELHSG